MDYDAVTQIGDGAFVQYETVKTLGSHLVAIIPEVYQNQIPLFESIGVPVIVTGSHEASFEGVKQALSIVGKALGEDFRADLITQFFDLQITRANTIAQTITNKPKVLILGASTPLSVVSNDSILSLIAKTVGALNVAESVSGKQETPIQPKQLIQWNPDIIWIPSDATYSAEILLKDPAYSSIQAVKNQKVIVFPSLVEPWDYPTPAVCLGVNWAVHILYPEALPTVDMMRHIHEYYTMVYGQTFTAEQLGIQ